MTRMFSRFYPVTLTLLRIVAAFLFWAHGVQKLFGWFGGEAASAFSLMWVAGVLEAGGGLLIAAGLLTRPVAFLLCGEMAVAYFTAHFPNGFWPILNRGELAVLFCFFFLFLATAGAGKFSLDRLLAGRAGEGLGAGASRFYPQALTSLRVVTGVMFWQHGARKFGWLGGEPVDFLELRWFAGVLEFFGGPLIALGFLTRPLAFLLSGEMATAFWISHFPRGQGFWPILNGGEPSVLFCFLYLFLATAGPGLLSVDGLLARRAAKE